jgi:enamine deaminase RidA (YjgF/YER057c/UK114 family)
MTHIEPLFPEAWAPPVGYSHGVVASGRWVVLAGQVGWNPATGTFASDDFATQVAQALRNIVALLSAAGGTARDLVRLTWYITDKTAYLAARRDIGAAYRDIVGRHYPPMSVVVVSALVEDRAKVEIEATAVLAE